MRKYTNLDRLIIRNNEVLNIIFNIKSSGRDNPATNLKDNEMTNSDKNLTKNLMRVNHAGEVSAQGLYIGHALLAKTTTQKEMMLEMASEEKDHLDWCAQRITELKGSTSIFNPVWFIGSVIIGMASGLTNDKNALGFIEETEKQVAKHLESNIDKIPDEDGKTYSILEKMKSDEERHGNSANKSGAKEVPPQLKKIMGITANIMKFASYRL